MYDSVECSGDYRSCTWKNAVVAYTITLPKRLLGRITHVNDETIKALGVTGMIQYLDRTI